MKKLIVSYFLFIVASVLILINSIGHSTEKSEMEIQMEIDTNMSKLNEVYYALDKIKHACTNLEYYSCAQTYNPNIGHKIFANIMSYMSAVNDYHWPENEINKSNLEKLNNDIDILYQLINQYDNDTSHTNNNYVNRKIYFIARLIKIDTDLIREMYFMECHIN